MAGFRRLHVPLFISSRTFEKKKNVYLQPSWISFFSEANSARTHNHTCVRWKVEKGWIYNVKKRGKRKCYERDTFRETRRCPYKTRIIIPAVWHDVSVCYDAVSFVDIFIRMSHGNGRESGWWTVGPEQRFRRCVLYRGGRTTSMAASTTIQILWIRFWDVETPWRIIPNPARLCLLLFDFIAFEQWRHGRIEVTDGRRSWTNEDHRRTEIKNIQCKEHRRTDITKITDGWRLQIDGDYRGTDRDYSRTDITEREIFLTYDNGTDAPRCSDSQKWEDVHSQRGKHLM